MIEDLIDFIEIHPIVAFEAIYKSPFKKTWIQVCVYTMQEILMNTHKFWREIQQTKWHFSEERRLLPFVLHYYVQLYCEGEKLEFKFSWMETWMQNLYRVPQNIIELEWNMRASADVFF
jgi:hypothetical protein